MNRNSVFKGNPRIGFYYLCGALILTLLIPFSPDLIKAGLLWVVFSMLLLVTGYWGLGDIVYSKKRGKIPFLNQVLMAPVRFGQYLSLLYYRKQADPWSTVDESLYIGGLLTNQDAKHLIKNNVTAVLDLTAEFCETPQLMHLEYLNIPILDLTAPTPDQQESAVQFIQDQILKGHKVFIHCKVGYSRTASIVGAFLLKQNPDQPVELVIETLVKARPGMIIRPEALESLNRYKASEGTVHAQEKANSA